ncbi:MAG: hypothetical protein ABSC62_00790 [Terracidiphilus sp.]
MTILTTVHAQNQPAPADVADPNQSAPVDVVKDNQPVAGSNSELSVDYPIDQAGVLIQSGQWTVVANQYPTKTKLDRGWAASLSYGVVPAKIVAEYDGEHASTQVAITQPVLCLCHFMSLPGAPVLVRLHAKKGTRELDGGRMVVYPIVGGSRMADAKSSDLVPADVSHPDPQVWLIRPQFALDPGEYALMLGTQNMSIFPFTVLPPPARPSATN